MRYCENGHIEDKEFSAQIIKNQIARRIADLAIADGVTAIRVTIEYDVNDFQYTVKQYNGRKVINVVTLAGIE